MSRPSHLWISIDRRTFIDLVEVISFERFMEGPEGHQRERLDVWFRCGRISTFRDGLIGEVHQALLAYLNAEMAPAPVPTTPTV